MLGSMVTEVGTRVLRAAQPCVAYSSWACLVCFPYKLKMQLDWDARCMSAAL